MIEQAYTGAGDDLNDVKELVRCTCAYLRALESTST